MYAAAGNWGYQRWSIWVGGDCIGMKGFVELAELNGCVDGQREGRNS
jgi:hypothetical protein